MGRLYNIETDSLEVSPYYDKGSPQIGQSLCYPSEEGFYYDCRIPEDVARVWLDTIGYRFFAEHPASYIPPFNQWLNKLAIIVDISECKGEIVAVYKHDFSIWIIKRKID